MIAYLLKFILCSGLLLLVYRLLLANESMYRFNRIYLLLSLVFSLTVPFITRTVPAEVVQPVIEQPVMISNNVIPIHAVTVQHIAPEYSNCPVILLALYGIVAAILLIRFVVNLSRIRRSIKESTAVPCNKGHMLLTNKQLTPHSFFNCIFINKDDYNDGLIAPEIICHEQAHVKQLHSLDVLLIELLQVVCWFNPFILFYRKAIQLNHEFLADKAVIRTQYDTPSYQYLLLTKASQFNSLSLTSQFNYPIIKKRLIMMTKTTSAKMIIIKQLALVPVFLGSLLLFSQKVAARGASVAAKAPNQKTSYNKVAKEGPQVVISANYTPMHSAKYNAPNRIIAAYHAILKKYKLSIDSEKRVHRAGPFSESDQKQLIALYEQMSSEQQDNQFVSFSKNRPPFPSVVPTEQQLNKWKDAKVYHIWVNNKRVRNDELNKHNASDFDWYYEDGISSTNYKYAVQMMTKSFHADDSKRAKAIMDGYQLSYNLDGDL